jgi:acyl dehydratase
MRMRYFEDLVIGQVEESVPRTVDHDAMLAFARQYDPQYFHADVEDAKRSSFGGVIASGIYTMALWRQLDHEIAHDIAWICGIAWDHVRFPLALRAGDTIRARAQCLSKRESRKHAGRGVVVYEYELFNQRDELVFTCRSTNLVERRATATTAAG